MKLFLIAIMALSSSCLYSQTAYYKVYEISMKKLNTPDPTDCVPVKVDYTAIVSRTDVTIIAKDREVYSFLSNISNVDTDGFLFRLYTCRMSDVTGVIQIMEQKGSYAKEGLIVAMLPGFEITYRIRKE